MKSKINVVLGLNYEICVGEQHQKGICGLLTGMDQTNGMAGQYREGPLHRSGHRHADPDGKPHQEPRGRDSLGDRANRTADSTPSTR